MKTLPCILVLATFSLPLSVDAQIVHVGPDPEPETDRCQNSTTAYHANSDIVRVDYHGQWRDHQGGTRSQNGGPNHGPCATERIARIDPRGQALWELRSNDPQSAISPTDLVRDLVAHPDGSTLVSISGGTFGDHTATNVLLVDTNGHVRWSVRTTRAPRFSTAKISIGEGNAIFVSYSFTNYGYDGGTFQLPGGRVWELRKNEFKTVVARLDPGQGRIHWEREGGEIVSADNGELLIHKLDTRGTSPVMTRHRFERLSYDGEPLSAHHTEWFRSESSLTVARKGDEVWMTTAAETLDATNRRVVHRISNLRVFSLNGELLHTRELSDGAKLASPAGSGPLRIVSPTQCDRGVSGRESCVTASLEVLALDSWRENGTTTRVQVPSHRFRSTDFHAQSTVDGVWISGETYYDSSRSRKPAIAVTTLYAADSARTPIEDPSRLVWRPIQASESPAPIPSTF